MKYVLLISSVVSGLMIWFGLSTYETSLEQKYLSQKPAARTTTVFVYNRDVNFGETTAEAMFTPQERLLTSLPDDYVSYSESTKGQTLQRFLGKTLARDVKKFDLLRDKDFILQPNRSLSASLEADARAVAIKVSEEKIAGGFVLPGDRVDLVATISKDFDGDGVASARSFTFLTNVKVLAVGQDASIGKKPGAGIALPGATTADATETKLGNTITLQLAAPQVEILTAASQVAKLSVALRRPSDQTEAALGDVSFLETAVQTPPFNSVNPNASQLTPQDDKKQLTILNGEKVQVYTFD